VLNLVKLAGEALLCLSFSAWAALKSLLLVLLEKPLENLTIKNQFRLGSELVLRI
jgi:hypothetical protein